jgi:hypothetical protein
MFRYWRLAVTLILALVGYQWAATPNEPLNQDTGLDAMGTTPRQRFNKQTYAEPIHEDPQAEDGLLIGVTFSGGGTRAVAYGYGILREIEATHVNVLGHRTSLFEHIDILSGVSGGSVLCRLCGAKGARRIGRFSRAVPICRC